MPDPNPFELADLLLATTNEEQRGETALLLARTVLALHVIEIRRCGDCPWRESGFRVDCCWHLEAPLGHRMVGVAKPPPKWCPLRAAGGIMVLRVLP